ncbi:MAG: prepilin-type N-terminal cleavage/methylation domain-containing protein [Oligoflexus sp.]|nr:prepilin-type N-terminal cleavage/methylation domain-containing protein [Oligoflexus sp.]
MLGDFCLKKNRESNQGFSLIEVMIAMGILVVVVLATSTLYTYSLESAEKVGTDSEIDSLRVAFMRSINCNETLPDPSLKNCPTENDQPVEPFLTLQRRTIFGLRDITTLKEKGTYKYKAGRFGRYLVRTSCSWKDQSLVVEAVLINSKNPASKVDWLNNHSDKKKNPILLFGKGAGFPLCFNREVIGSTGQYRVYRGDKQKIEFGQVYGPAVDRAVELKLGEANDRGRGIGIACKMNEGWQMTGCFISDVLDPDNPGELNVDTDSGGNNCFVSRNVSKINSYGKKVGMEPVLTVMCLKVK